MRSYASPTHRACAVCLLLLLALPLLWSVWSALAAACDTAAWRALLQAAPLQQAVVLSLWTGVASTLLATGIAAWILADTVGQLGGQHQNHLSRLLAPLLAVPHAAFAIGLVALLAPSGWILRLLSPWASGLSAPPPWPTTQDPWGLGLVLVLVLKEVPFLLWAALAHLQRPDVARRLQQELRLARTLGYSHRGAWWRVAWPQLLPRLTAPVLAVLAYGLTVVDVALVIGPTTPPTLAVLAWQWLQDASPTTHAQGAAAAWLLAVLLALCAASAWALQHLPVWHRRWTRGTPVQPTSNSTQPARAGALWLLAVVYGAVMLALLLGSVVGSWPFPQLWPDSFSAAAWHGVWGSSAALSTTVWLALASSGSALVWAVAWLEWAPAHWQARAYPLLMVPLVLPTVLWAVGLHQLSLAWQIDSTGTGLWLAHTLACVPYVLIALQGPYRGFDRRLGQVSASLGHSHGVFLLRVKWPLLRAALAAAAAVGFAVSVAQYLPTLYVGGGRFSTVSTEAITLAAGGQRSLSAAFAWLQWLLPVLAFALAARWGQARTFASLRAIMQRPTPPP